MLKAALEKQVYDGGLELELGLHAGEHGARLGGLEFGLGLGQLAGAEELRNGAGGGRATDLGGGGRAVVDLWVLVGAIIAGGIAAGGVPCAGGLDGAGQKTGAVGDDV